MPDQTAEKIATQLATKGHLIDLIIGSWQDSKKSSLTAVPGIKIYSIQMSKSAFIQAYLYSEPLKKRINNLLTHHEYDVIHTFFYPSLLVGYQADSKAKKIITLNTFSFEHASTVIKPIIAHALSHYDVIHTSDSDLASKIKTQTRRLAVILPKVCDVIDDFYATNL